jgi:hypothetical protein
MTLKVALDWYDFAVDGMVCVIFVSDKSGRVISVLPTAISNYLKMKGNRLKKKATELHGLYHVQYVISSSSDEMRQYLYIITSSILMIRL